VGADEYTGTHGRDDSAGLSSLIRRYWKWAKGCKGTDQCSLLRSVPPELSSSPEYSRPHSVLTGKRIETSPTTELIKCEYIITLIAMTLTDVINSTGTATQDTELMQLANWELVSAYNSFYNGIKDNIHQELTNRLTAATSVICKSLFQFNFKIKHSVNLNELTEFHNVCSRYYFF
jgi:hypothetical protein